MHYVGLNHVHLLKAHGSAKIHRLPEQFVYLTKT